MDDGYNVHITDTSTGEKRTYRHDSAWDDVSDFMWSDGNYACDCNRGIFFGCAGGEDIDYECGDSRFHVRITDDAGNELYADDAPEPPLPTLVEADGKEAGKK